MSTSSKPNPAYKELAAAIDQIGLGPFAKTCGVSYQAVQRWVSNERVPANRCKDVELAVGGRVTRYDLRPDVFGASAAAEQQAGTNLREVG